MIPYGKPDGWSFNFWTSQCCVCVIQKTTLCTKLHPHAALLDLHPQICVCIYKRRYAVCQCRHRPLHAIYGEKHKKYKSLPKPFLHCGQNGFADFGYLEIPQLLKTARCCDMQIAFSSFLLQPDMHSAKNQTKPGFRKSTSIGLFCNNLLYFFPKMFFIVPCVCFSMQAACKASVVFCHYCVMCNFFWLLVEAVYLNSLLVSTFPRIRRCLWSFALLGWGETRADLCVFLSPRAFFFFRLAVYCWVIKAI